MRMRPTKMSEVSRGFRRSLGPGSSTPGQRGGAAPRRRRRLRARSACRPSARRSTVIDVRFPSGRTAMASARTGVGRCTALRGVSIVAWRDVGEHQRAAQRASLRGPRPHLRAPRPRRRPTHRAYGSSAPRRHSCPGRSFECHRPCAVVAYGHRTHIDSTDAPGSAHLSHRDVGALRFSVLPVLAILIQIILGILLARMTDRAECAAPALAADFAAVVLDALIDRVEQSLTMAPIAFAAVALIGAVIALWAASASSR